MAPQDNLIEIAQELAMIDDFYLRPRRSNAPPKTIDSEQAARRYGGVIDVTGPPKTIDSEQAARRYGGVTDLTGPRQQGCLYQHWPSQSVVHQVKPVPATEGKTSFYEGGASMMDYSKRKSRAMAF